MMIQVGPNRLKSMTRDQLEAHLTLLGWQPINYSIAGAALNDVIVFVQNKTKVWETGADEPSARITVNAVWNQEPDFIAKKRLDLWLWDDYTFHTLAIECARISTCDHTNHSTPFNGVNAWRCESCHQLI